MRQGRWQFVVLMFIAGAVAMMLTGCPPRTAQQPDEDTRVAGIQERVTQVNVGMTEYAFTLDPAQAPAGDVVFTVRNTGDVVHAFEIEGQGIEQRTPRMQSGETQILETNTYAPTYAAPAAFFAIAP